jgi:hypothetical protein
MGANTCFPPALNSATNWPSQTWKVDLYEIYPLSPMLVGTCVRLEGLGVAFCQHYAYRSCNAACLPRSCVCCASYSSYCLSVSCRSYFVYVRLQVPDNLAGLTNAIL